ncbi:MAG TPA: hypothetical protein VMS54_03365 [Vicinamibacterales bacterium]|nr:hypothetical protein [Vicinamibacterales bacterium]
MVRSVYRTVGITAGLLGVIVTVTGAAGQRGAASKSRTTAPNGAEIAAAARAGRLDTGNAATATMFGKPFKFTPAQVPAKADKPGDGNGDFLGVLENGAAGDETGLPAGKYNLYVATVNGQLKGYAEANGQIVKEAIRASSTPAPEGAKGRPQFIDKGWSVRVYMCSGYASPFNGEITFGCHWRTISW